MKKLIILLALLPILSSGHPVKSENRNFIVVEGTTIYCNEVYSGPDNTKIYTAGGEIVKISTSKIDAYSVNGKLFEKLPIVNLNNEISGWAFMQFISGYAGYRLYRYCSNCGHYDPSTGEINPLLPSYRYYVFKGGKFFSLTRKQDEKAQLAFFGIRQIV